MGGVTERGEEEGRNIASEVLPLPVGRSSMGTVSLEEDMAVVCVSIDNHLLMDRMTKEGMT